MNKRFSTLMAIALVAGGISSSALAAGPGDVKNGEYTFLTTTGGVLAIDATANTLKAVTKPTELADINKALWRVEVIKSAEVGGVPTYRFSNKANGQALVVKLQTAPTAAAAAGTVSISENEAKIEAGNDVWAWDASNGTLYAVKGDSIFSLNNQSGLKLQAKKRTSNSDIAVAANSATFAYASLSGESIALSAKGFNDFMKARGNDGKLHFNNGKDVTANETNAIKNVAWKAISSTTANTGTDLFLTNGNTKDGYKNDLTGKADFAKKEFLVVDTTYLDKISKEFFALTADTLGWEPVVHADGDYLSTAVAFTGDRAKLTKRHPSTALFNATLYYGNDSIVLQAKNLPDAQTAADASSSIFTPFNGDFETLKQTGLDATAEKTGLKNALAVLHAAYDAFKALGTSTDVTFANAYFKADGTSAATASGGETIVLGSKLISDVTAAAASITEVGTYTAGFGSLAVSSGALTDYASEAANYNAADAKTAENTAQITAINALAAAYTTFANMVYTDDSKALAFEAAYFSADGTQVSATNAGTTTTLGSALKSGVTVAASFVTGFTGVQHGKYQSNGTHPTSFHDGTNNLKVAGTSNKGGLVVLRELSNTKVLTVVDEAAATSLDGYILPLVQPYATAPSIGGTADVNVEKVYYVKNLMKGADGKSKDEGKFYNESPVATAGFLTEGQAFNPYAQYVAEKTAGTTKGSYTFYNRGTGEATDWTGVATQLSGDSIVIGGDTIMLVDSQIAYTANDSSKQIGYKNISAYDLINKSFKIHSASPFMKDMFMHMQADSTLKVQADEVLYTIEPVVGTYDDYGAKVAKIDTLVREAYYVKSKNGEYLVKTNDGYVLSKDAAKINTKITLKGTNNFAYVVNTAFFFVATDNADTYVMVPATVAADATEAAKVESLTNACVDVKMVEANKVLVNAQTGSVEMATSAAAKNDLFFVGEEDTPASLFTMPKTVEIKALNGDLLVIGKDNFAAAARVGDLKAAYAADDFKFLLDTARYKDNTGKDLVTPSYYVTKGFDIESATQTATKRMYMWTASDSTAAKVKPEQYTYDTKTRLQFREAQRYGADSLIVVNLAGNDTVSVVEQKAAANKSAIYKTINSFRFNFLVDADNASSYVIKQQEAKNYVQNVNGILVVTSEIADAMRVTVTETSGPVANDDIDAATVSVVASNGAIVINNAAGKKVAISNILGQTIANTVITSDNATIAAPAGVVVVAVEGEAAVKAIVK